MIHKEKSELAGKTVIVKKGKHEGSEYRIEDWWDRLSGKSWMVCDGNPACLDYAMRTGLCKNPVPDDDEVLYGKIGCLGKLIHISEI